MTSFRILRSDVGTGIRIHDTQVDTSSDASGAHADVQTRDRIENPLFGIVPGIRSPWLLDRTRTSSVDGAPSSALGTAIAALQELGAANHVVGISLAHSDAIYGPLMFDDSRASYQAGSGVEERIGAANAWKIDAAAKHVMQLLDRA